MHVCYQKILLSFILTILQNKRTNSRINPISHSDLATHGNALKTVIMLILKSLKIKFHKINVITSNSYLQEKEKFTYI